MTDDVWDEPDDVHPFPGLGSPSDGDRERLRAVLDFPESIETSGSFERHGWRRSRPAPPAPEAIPPVEEPEADDEVGRRLQQLTSRVEAVAGLVETLFDRVESSVAGPSASLTIEELADIAARIVHIIEERIATQTERLQEAIAAQPAPEPRLGVIDGGSADLGLIDDHLAMIGRALLEMQQSIAHLESPSDMQEIGIFAHFDRWFEETNSRQATDVEHVRRDLHRFDEALIDLKATMAELPDRQALHELHQAFAQVSPPEGVGDLLQAMSELPRRVALDQPIARLDASIVEQLSVRLEETSAELAQKFDDQLSERMRRFEALSQAMMTMVGDPVDSLSTKLSLLVRAQEAAPNVLHSIGELTQIQGQLAAAIKSLRQEGVAREALLREALDKIDRLSGEPS